jgi:hypothetical protein
MNNNVVELYLYVFPNTKEMIEGEPISFITIDSFFVPDVGDIMELRGVGYAVHRRTFCFNGEDHDPQWSCALEVIPVH